MGRVRHYLFFTIITMIGVSSASQGKPVNVDSFTNQDIGNQYIEEEARPHADSKIKSLSSTRVWPSFGATIPYDIEVAQSREGRCARGSCGLGKDQSESYRIPQFGEPVGGWPAHPGPDVPDPLQDRQGHYLPHYEWEDFYCSAGWGEYCEETFMFNLADGWEYCVHHFIIREWNYARFQVLDVTKTSLKVHIRAHGGSFYDRHGGHIRGTIVVGAVPSGHYNTQACLPMRTWAMYCHGKNQGIQCFTDSPCASLRPIEKLQNDRCLVNERLPVRNAPTKNTPPPVQIIPKIK